MACSRWQDTGGTLTWALLARAGDRDPASRAQRENSTHLHYSDRHSGRQFKWDLSHTNLKRGISVFTFYSDVQFMFDVRLDLNSQHVNLQLTKLKVVQQDFLSLWGAPNHFHLFGKDLFPLI